MPELKLGLNQNCLTNRPFYVVGEWLIRITPNFSLALARVNSLARAKKLTDSVSRKCNCNISIIRYARNRQKVSLAKSNKNPGRKMIDTRGASEREYIFFKEISIFPDVCNC